MWSWTLCNYFRDKVIHFFKKRNAWLISLMNDQDSRGEKWLQFHRQIYTGVPIFMFVFPLHQTPGNEAWPQWGLSGPSCQTAWTWRGMLSCSTPYWGENENQVQLGDNPKSAVLFVTREKEQNAFPLRVTSREQQGESVEPLTCMKWQVRGLAGGRGLLVRCSWLGHLYLH